MNVAVFSDSVYQRSRERLYADETFVVFASGLADHVDHLMLVGRCAPDPGTGHYALREDVDFLPLPYYQSLAEPATVLSGLARSVWRFWRALRDVEAVWIIGPNPLSLVFAAQAALRRKRLVLGVRQDLPAHIRSRHPDRPVLHVGASVLEGAWRALARCCPTIVVGTDLARKYRTSRQLEVMAVSLVDERDVVDTETALRPRSGLRYLLSVGRLDPEKNPLLLADVLAKLRADDDSWRLVVCGDGVLFDQLVERIESMGLAPYCHMLGYLPLDQLWGWYRRSDVLLHASWTEGVPQVLFEAFAAGLPVVATDVGGVAAMVGDSGLLIPPGDPGAAADAVSSIATDEELRSHLVLGGLAVAREHLASTEVRRVANLLCDRSRGGHPGFKPPPYSMAWVWAVLPASCRRVGVVGPGTTHALLRDLGLVVVPQGAETETDAVLIAWDQGDVASLPLGPQVSPLVAVTVGGYDYRKRARWRRFASSPADLLEVRRRAARVVQTVAARGWSPSVVPIGNRMGRHVVGKGNWSRFRRLPVDALVVGRSPEVGPSAADEALARAGQAMGRDLHRRRLVVCESGKILQEIDGPEGERYFQYLAAGPARSLIERSLAVRGRLLSATDSPAILERVPTSICTGETGLLLWSLERGLPGSNPRRMSPHLWDDCFEFLVALHWAGRDGTVAGDPDHWDRLRASLDMLTEVADPGQCRALLKLERRLHDTLDILPLGWGHGDMWRENLLVDDGRLRFVLDWDWSTPRCLPLLDLLDLTAHSSRDYRSAAPSSRLSKLLRPVDPDLDRRIRSYWDAVELHAGKRTLEGLSIAYWLDRTSRDILDPHGRGHHPWADADSLSGALALLGERGWV